MSESFNDAESELVWLREQQVDLQKGNKALKDGLMNIQNTVNKQAEDEGLWFDARTVSEAYLQMELRELHAVIERIGLT